MNILHKGRLYSDEPHPFTEVEAQDRYTIERVSLLVSLDGSKGRWEAHENSRELMRRLDTIGRSKAVLKGLSIAGKAIAPIHTTALNLYLKACEGLQSFRRDNPFYSTRSDLESLLSKVGINYDDYAGHNTHQIYPRPGNPGRS